MAGASEAFQIRAFDGSLGDGQAIVEIDRATFADSPYSAEQIVALEADAGQHAWMALERDRIVGYVSAFATYSLAAGRWEVDELAVHPQAQGRGIGTALVARALAVGAEQGGLREARALVAADNLASQRVFAKNGFRVAGTVHLLSYRVNGRTPRRPRPGAPLVRPAQAGEGAALARLLAGGAASPARVAAQMARPDVHYLVAVENGALLGGMELVHVRTLQYEGLWVESLAVTPAGRGPGAVENRAALALLGAAIERVKRQDGMDLVGYLVAPRKKALHAAAVAEGMGLVDVYKSYVYEW